MRTRAWLLAFAALALVASAAEAQQRDQQGARAGARVSPRGWIGISFRGLGEEGMAVIEDVYPDSPAERAGLQQGDTLVLWNGRRDVGQAVGERLQPGDTVRLRVRRGGGRDQDLAVVAAERSGRILGVRRGGPGRDVIVISPQGLERELRIHAGDLAVQIDSMHRRLQLMLRDSLGPQLRRLEAELPEIRIYPGGRGGGGTALFDLGRRAVAGAEFTELNEGLSSYFDADRGALVLRVAPDSPAERAGLQAGDVVLEANDQKVESVADLRRVLARARGRDEARAVEMEVLRKGKRRELQLRWE